MAQGQTLTERQIETIRFVYAETMNMREAARQAHCSPNAAKKYINSSNDDYAQLRAEKKLDIIEEVAAVRLVLLEAMKTPAKIEKASITELATSFGILTDKYQIMTGKPTSRTESLVADPTYQLTPEEMEQASRIREKLAHDVGVT